MEVLLLIALVAALILGLQIWAVVAWAGVWRWLAAAPLLLLAADLLLILVSTAIDPTSHNLWPLELAMIVLIGPPTVALLWLARLVARA
jgi:hypothetical protein